MVSSSFQLWDSTSAKVLSWKTGFLCLNWCCGCIMHVCLPQSVQKSILGQHHHGHSHHLTPRLPQQPQSLPPPNPIFTPRFVKLFLARSDPSWIVSSLVILSHPCFSSTLFPCKSAKLIGGSGSWLVTWANTVSYSGFTPSSSSNTCRYSSNLTGFFAQ